MKTALAFSFAAVSLILVGTLPAWADLLFFEDFESDLSQWDVVGSSIITSAYGFNSAHSQTFTQVAAGGDARTVKLAAPGQTYYLHVAYMTLGGGGFIGIDLFNVSQTSVGEQWLIGDGGYPALSMWDYNVGAQDPADLGVWKQYTQAYTPAANVAYIRIKTEDWNGGLPNNPTTAGVFLDNIEWSTSPQPIPAPGAIVLGLMGLGAVGVWMRRYA